jgi:hypothetical protein
VSGYGTAVHSRTVGMVKGAKVLSSGSVVVMGMVEGHYIASSRDGEARVSPSTRGYVVLISGFLEDSMQ